jgi:hypothetical protein
MQPERLLLLLLVVMVFVASTRQVFDLEAIAAGTAAAGEAEVKPAAAKTT